MNLLASSAAFFLFLKIVFGADRNVPLYNLSYTPVVPNNSSEDNRSDGNDDGKRDCSASTSNDTPNEKDKGSISNKEEIEKDKKPITDREDPNKVNPNIVVVGENRDEKVSPNVNKDDPISKAELDDKSKTKPDDDTESTCDDKNKPNSSIDNDKNSGYVNPSTNKEFRTEKELFINKISDEGDKNKSNGKDVPTENRGNTVIVIGENSVSEINNNTNSRFNDLYIYLEHNIKEINNILHDRFLELNDVNEIHHEEIKDILNRIAVKNEVSKEIDDDYVIFPGNNDDYTPFISIITKVSACKKCCTCKKNGMCMLNTMKELISIAGRYIDWIPPKIDNRVFSGIKMNSLLKDVLKEIASKKDNTCPVNVSWLINPRIKHLMDPIFIASLKLPPMKNSNDQINPAFILALSKKNGESGINPVLSSMLINNDSNKNKINPALLMLLKNGKIDPMMMMAIMDSNKENGKSSGNLGLIMALAQKRNGNDSNGYKYISSCQNNANPSTEQSSSYKHNQFLSDGINKIDPLILSLMNGNEKDLSKILLMKILMDKKRSSNQDSHNFQDTCFNKYENSNYQENCATDIRKKIDGKTGGKKEYVYGENYGKI